jgi:prevent-host-death family protein
MEFVPAYDMRFHIGKVLRRVAEGEEIVITWHGHPVARLIPEGQARPRRPTAVPKKVRDRMKKSARTPAGRGKRRDSGRS